MIDHFGFLAPFYEKFIRPRGPEPLYTLAKLPVDGTLLDVGGGTGRIAYPLRDYCKQAVVIDKSLKMLYQSSAKGGLSSVCSLAETLPISDQSVARVLMVDALHHVQNQKETLSELWRILQPGGCIVIEEPDIDTLAVKIIAIAEKAALMRSHFLSAASVAAMFSDTAARVTIKRQSYNYFVVIDRI